MKKKPKQQAKQDKAQMMWDCGKWLERFLNDDLRLKDFQELAKSAIKTLNIKFKLTDKEPSLMHIAKIEEIADLDIPLFDQWADIRAMIPILTWNEEFKAINFENGGKWGLKEFNDFQTPIIDREMAPLTMTKEAMIAILKGLINSKLEWDKAIPEIIENENNSIIKSAIELNLIGGTGSIVGHHEIEKNRLKQINSFLPDVSDLRPTFHWNTVAAEIFFKFLEFGGMEYFTFCDYCGKFSVVQRKGRKRFCSDNCRVYWSKK